MSLKGLNLDSEVKHDDADVLSGSRSFTSDTGVYNMLIDVAYMGKAASGAVSINIHYKDPAGKRTIRQTLWVKSGDKKGNKTYWVDDKGVKHYLPGYSQARHIALITTGKELGDLTAEEKTIKLYDFQAKGEVNTKVAALTEMHNKPIRIGVHKIRANKVEKKGNKYVDLPEAREFNEIDKVFYPDGRTHAEVLAEATEPKFLEKWQNKFTSDFVDDRYKEVAGTSSEDDDDALPDTDTDKPNLFGDGD